jgi:hypothetical protein
MFKRGFTLPNVIALILGLCVVIYFALAKKDATQDSSPAAEYGQSGN